MQLRKGKKLAAADDKRQNEHETRTEKCAKGGTISVENNKPPVKIALYPQNCLKMLTGNLRRISYSKMRFIQRNFAAKAENSLKTQNSSRVRKSPLTNSPFVSVIGLEVQIIVVTTNRILAPTCIDSNIHSNVVTKVILRINEYGYGCRLNLFGAAHTDKDYAHGQ